MTIGPGEGRATISEVSFVVGTRIATPDGPRRIEDLAPGAIITAAIGEPRSVRRITQQRIDIAAHPSPTRVTPVHLRAGALGPDLPLRDLLLPAESLVFFPSDAVLAPIGALLNGAGIARAIPTGLLTWCRLELDSPGILLAEDVAIATAHPRTSPPPAPIRLLQPGPELAALRARLNALPIETNAARVVGGDDPAGSPSAGDPILSLPHDPGRPVRLFVDQTELPATAGETGEFTFTLPANCGPARLVSAVHDAPGQSDGRRLGVCITSIRIGRRPLDLDGPGFGPGFHPMESDRNGRWRWTDGSAWLVLAHRPVGQRLTIVINDWHALLG